MIEDAWNQLRQAGESLREHKKRITRQRISDVATRLFVERGFDNVPISEIAMHAGVSEKTVYNYFPNKEALVFDHADEQFERLTAAVRERPEGPSAVAAFVAALKRDMRQLIDSIDAKDLEFLPLFDEMVGSTPALQAAWGQHRHQMVEGLSQIIAGELGVDAHEPEPRTVARGLVSLYELYFDSQMRHARSGRGKRAVRAGVERDIDRGARMLEDGFRIALLKSETQRAKEAIKAAARGKGEEAKARTLAEVERKMRGEKSGRSKPHR